MYVGAVAREERIGSVCLDDEQVAYEATKHLLDLGHRSIAMVTGPMEEDCSRDRSAGYRRALEEAGLKYDPCLVIEGDWSASSGQAGFAHFIDLGLQPTAVFAQNAWLWVFCARRAIMIWTFRSNWLLLGLMTCRSPHTSIRH